MKKNIITNKELFDLLEELRDCHEPTIDDFIKRHANSELSIKEDFSKIYRTAYLAHLIYSGDYIFSG